MFIKGNKICTICIKNPKMLLHKCTNISTRIKSILCAEWSGSGADSVDEAAPAAGNCGFPPPQNRSSKAVAAPGLGLSVQLFLLTHLFFFSIIGLGFRYVLKKCCPLRIHLLCRKCVFCFASLVAF